MRTHGARDAYARRTRTGRGSRPGERPRVSGPTTLSSLWTLTSHQVRGQPRLVHAGGSVPRPADAGPLARSAVHGYDRHTFRLWATSVGFRLPLPVRIPSRYCLHPGSRRCHFLVVAPRVLRPLVSASNRWRTGWRRPCSTSPTATPPA